MLAALVIAAGQRIGNVLNVHIFCIADDLVDLAAHPAGGADVPAAEQAADAAGERHQHWHRILDQPCPIAAALRQGLGQPIDGAGQRRQRAEKQQHARHRQAGGQRRALQPFGSRLRAGVGAAVEGAHLGIIDRRCVDTAKALSAHPGLFFKAAELAVLHGGIQPDEDESQRPPYHKADDNGPPRELERAVPGVVFAAVVVVLVARAAAGVGVIRVRVLGSFVLVGHGWLLRRSYRLCITGCLPAGFSYPRSDSRCCRPGRDCFCCRADGCRGS